MALSDHFRFSCPLTLLSGIWVSLSACKTTNSTSEVAAAGSAKTYNIVSLGDSYAAGEGNPVFDAVQFPVVARKAQWTRTGTKEQMADTLRCHRSDRSGHQQAYTRLAPFFREKKIKSHYVAFSCSGARIDSGLLGPYPGAEPPENIAPNPGITWLKPQLQQLDEYYQKTKPGEAIDVMLVSIGGNDFNFAPIITECVNPLAGNCNESRTVKGVFEDTDSKIPEVKKKFRDLLTVLSGGTLPSSASYVVENSEGKSMGISSPYRKMKTKVKRVIFVAYPNPVVGSEGGGHYYCNGNIPEKGGLADWIDPKAIAVDFGEHLREPESRYVETVALKNINDVINAAAKEQFGDLKVSVVNGLAARFRGHGICANAQRRWINTNMDAEQRQGKIDFGILWPKNWSYRPFFIPGASAGFVHPNNLGYQAMADEILKVLEPIATADHNVTRSEAMQSAKERAKDRLREKSAAAAKEVAAARAAALKEKIKLLSPTSPEIQTLANQLQEAVAKARGTAEDEEEPVALPEE